MNKNKICLTKLIHLIFIRKSGFNLITGKLSDSNLQVKHIEDKNMIKALKYIENTNFSSFNDNIYELEGKNLFFILSSYKTVTSISERIYLIDERNAVCFFLSNLQNSFNLRMISKFL